MKKFAMLAGSAAIGYMETCEVVLASISGHKGPVRVNKDDFDADQEKPSGERRYSKYSGSDEPEQSNMSSVKTYEELGVVPQAAPSAPDFTGGNTVSPAPVDETKQAIAPSVALPTDMLVMKDNGKFFIVNGMGEKLEDDGIDTAGYKTEKAARDAIATLRR